MNNNTFTIDTLKDMLSKIPNEFGGLEWSGKCSDCGADAEHGVINQINESEQGGEI